MILTMPVGTLVAVILLVALAVAVAIFVIVDRQAERLRDRLRTVEQQLHQVLALANQERVVAGALENAVLATQRQMLREAVAGQLRLGKEVNPSALTRAGPNPDR